jgi:uncharacterized membrane protein
VIWSGHHKAIDRDMAGTTVVAPQLKPSLLAALVLALLLTSAMAANYWNSGTATFYGGADGSGTMGT